MPFDLMNRRFAGPAVVALVVGAGSMADAAYVVLPEAQATTEGGTQNTSPFSMVAGRSTRYQQVYAASGFATTSSFYITQIAFRPNHLTAAFSATANVELSFSTTVKGPDTLSTTFSENVGADAQLSYNDAWTIATAATGPVGGPKDFDIVLNLQTPFLYNPAAGNLLMDVKVRNTSGLTFTLDAQNTEGDSVSRVFSFPTEGGADHLVNSGSALSIGLVTRFTVPEPSVAGLAILGGLALLRRKRI